MPRSQDADPVRMARPTRRSSRRPAKKPARRVKRAPARRASPGKARSPRKASTPRKATGARRTAKRAGKRPGQRVAKRAVSRKKAPRNPAKRAPAATRRKAKAAASAKKAAAPREQRPARPTMSPPTPAPVREVRAKPAAAAPAREAPVEFKLAPVEFSEFPRSSKPLRIALFGASGNLGTRIAEEAVRRGHTVTALVREPTQMTGQHPNLRVLRGDVTDPLQVEAAARAHDVVASAIAPPPTDPGVLVEAAQSLLAGGRASGKRVMVVGGAGSLEAKPGQQLVDTPAFPAAWRPVASAHRDALAVFRAEGGEGWTVLSPSALIEPGSRTGKFRLGGDQLLGDAKGNSRISMEDYAVAFVDELEKGEHLGKRFTVGY